MQQLQVIVQSSGLYHLLSALCLWIHGQWQESWVIQWFIHPPLQQELGASQSSIFWKLWQRIQRMLHRLYQALHLDRLLRGSILLNTGLWSGMAVVLAPVLPTMGVLALVLVSVVSLGLALMRDENRGLCYSPVNRYIWIYGLIYGVGTLFSVTLRGSLLGGSLTVLFVMFTLVLENSIQSRRQLDTVLMLVVLVGTGVALYGITQYLFGWGYQSAAWVDTNMFQDISFRVTGTLENPNMLGQYLILTILLGGAGLLSAKDWGVRVFYLCSCGVMSLCMVLTFSRGAWVGLLIAGFVFLLFWQPKLLLLAPVGLVLLYFLLPDTVIHRFISIGDLSDRSTSYRVYIWMGTLAMLRDYWMCGIGPGGQAFNLVYPKYSYSGVTSPHAHNLFLQIICDAGIVALIIFLLLLFHWVRQLCASFCQEKDPVSRLNQAAMLGGMAGFLAQAMTDYSFYNYRVMFIFWAYLGLGILVSRRSQLPERSQGDDFCTQCHQ